MKNAKTEREAKISLLRDVEAWGLGGNRPLIWAEEMAGKQAQRLELNGDIVRGTVSNSIA